jgi:hypothetical protein
MSQHIFFCQRFMIPAIFIGHVEEVNHLAPWVPYFAKHWYQKKHLGLFSGQPKFAKMFLATTWAGSCSWCDQCPNCIWIGKHMQSRLSCQNSIHASVVPPPSEGLDGLSPTGSHRCPKGQ